MRVLASIAMLAALAALAANADAAPSTEQLYREGQQAFNRGDYTTAIARWQASYERSKLPLLVLNLATAYRHAGDCAHALSMYRRYVALDPASKQRSLVDRSIAQLVSTCGASSPLHVDQLPLPVDDSSSTYSPKLLGIVTGGTGAVLVTTGLVFGSRASTLGAQVTHDCMVSCDWAIEKSKDSDGKRDATVGKVLDGFGLAAVAVGVGMYVYGGRARQPAVTIQPGAYGATLSWSGRW